MTKEELITHLQGIEWEDFEAKEAKDKVPSNVWESVSAFCNTSGGWIVFGIKQIGKKFEVQGVSDGERIESDFLNTLRGGQKMNVPLFPTAKKYSIDGKTILAFYVQSSPEKPIYFGSLNNVFVRSASHDRKATNAEISAMFRDQMFGVKSEQYIEGTSLDDINMDDLARYRKRIREFNPSFPYVDYETQDFCIETGICNDKGLVTYGGLLMFGKRLSVQKYVRNFWIDYLEIPGTSYDDAVARYSYRMPEQDNLWQYYEVLIQRLRLHVPEAPFTAGPNGHAPDDESELYALREGLVNMEAHADFFSTMHCTIRVFDNKIEFQNPGRFMLDMDELGKQIHSIPRNPEIIRLFRYAKLGENAGYGIGKMKKWESLTGEKVTFETDMISSTITYYRPSKTTIKNHGETTIKTTMKNKGKTTIKVRDKVLKIIRSTPTISIDEIARICNMSRDGIIYHIKSLKKAGILSHTPERKGGHWIIHE